MNMNTCDEIVLGFLQTHAGFAHNQLDHLQAWWLATRKQGEDLAAFLFRQQLLSDPTIRIFQHVADKHLSAVLGSALIDKQEMSQLRQRLPEVAIVEADEGLPATVTLLNGGDTDKDSVGSLPDVHIGELPRVGMSLGKYLLDEWVGAGSTGVVFRAMHPTLQIPVAVKVLHPAMAAEEQERQRRFMAEARVLARLNHPNIVRVFDFEQGPEFPFLVLEYVNGPNLAELIGQSGRIQPHRAVHIMRQLADALATAHHLGVVHRDIKPANVLLTRDGETKLADLGLAMVSHPAAEQNASPLPANARVGTVSYIAPELAGGEPAGERRDMYSLGATFYHALTGVPPFEGNTPWQVLSHHSRTQPVSPRVRVPDLPRELTDLILRMLAKLPDHRPAGFAALLQDPALEPAPQHLKKAWQPQTVPSLPTDCADGTRFQRFWRRIWG